MPGEEDEKDKIPEFSADELERLGVPAPRHNPVAAHEVQRKARLQNDELESRQKLWRAILIAAVAILLLETLLAGRAMRLGLPSPSQRQESEPQSVTGQV